MHANIHRSVIHNHQNENIPPEYSDSYEYMTRDGVCESVTYTIMPAGSRTSKRSFYSCIANFTLSIEYEPAKEESAKQKNTGLVTGASGLSDTPSATSTVSIAGKSTSVLKGFWDM